MSAFFGGRPWTEFVDVPALRANECALALFTPVAFHYYVPAFMRATLADPFVADVIPFSIVSNFRQELGPAARERLLLFTPAQRTVVAHFLRALTALGLIDEEELEEIETLAQLLCEA